MTAGALAGVAAQGFSASLGALTGAMGAGGIGLGGLAIAGAVGSIASQAVGMAIGMQDKFSWGAVAVSAISTGLTYGTGPGGIAGQMGIKEGLTQAVVNGAVNNTISQGVGIVVGVQDKFSWQAVAASAVAGGVSYGIGEMLPKGFGSKPGTFDSFTRDFTKGLGSGVARLLVGGGKANWGGVAADAFGNALGYSIVEQSGGGSGVAQQAAELQRAEQESTFPGLNPYAASGQGLRVNGGGLAYAPSLEGGSDGAETDSSRVRTVTVRAGDTLTRVAGTADPQTLDQIAQFNGLRSRHEIKAGQTLNIPDGEILSRISVSGSVAARGAAGAAYYADLQQQRAEMAAQAATANYGNEGRSVPVAIVASAAAAPSGYVVAAAGEFDPLGTGAGNYNSSGVAPDGVVGGKLGAVLRGTVGAIADTGYEVLAMAADTTRIAGAVIKAGLANAPIEDIERYSALGKSGISTGEALFDMVTAPVTAPLKVGYNGTTALMNGDAEGFGRALGDGAVLFGGARVGGLSRYGVVVEDVGNVSAFGQRGASGIRFGAVEENVAVASKVQHDIARPLNSPNYTVAFETDLISGQHFPGKSDYVHFQASNESLYNAMTRDVALRGSLDNMYPGLWNFVQPGKYGAFSGKSPASLGLTWHHNAYAPGRMELMPINHHQSQGAVQLSLHPNKKGGMQIWGGGR